MSSPSHLLKKEIAAIDREELWETRLESLSSIEGSDQLYIHTQTLNDRGRNARAGKNHFHIARRELQKCDH
jgi:hypothetical protein